MSDSPNKRVIRVVAAIIRREDGKVLITQRRAKAFMPYKWEFPGGKVESGEDDQQAIIREIKEELDVEIVVGDHFFGSLHCYPDFDVDFQVYECSIVSGDLAKKAVHDYRWVAVSELEDFEFPPADHPTLERLVGE
jgi:mutator protein MutT